MRKKSAKKELKDSSSSDTLQRVTHLLNILEQLYTDIDRQQKVQHQQFEKMKSDAAKALSEARLHLNLLLQAGTTEASLGYQIPITDEKLKRAWEVLFRYPAGATADTVANGLDRHRSTVSTYLNMLVTLGFAEKFRDGHEIFYKAIIKSEKEENLRLRMAHKNASWDKVITIYSPGGGTGKSEIAASLAYVLAEKGKKIWLIDANLFAPSLDILYNLTTNNCDTLNEFLLNDALSEIPVCDISHVMKGRSKGRLYLTPSIRNDTEKRYQVERALIEDESTCEKIPEAVFRGLGDEIDFLIVDTHPGFERVNQVWLGMTNYLVILTRITDVDLENLKMHLKEKDLVDIRKKLILFNNVCLDKERTAMMAMNNRQMQEKFSGLIQNPSLITGSRDPSTEIFPNHIPYSEELALYPSSKGLYIQNHKNSQFAEIVTSLSEKIVKDLDTH